MLDAVAISSSDTTCMEKRAGSWSTLGTTVQSRIQGYRSNAAPRWLTPVFAVTGNIQCFTEGTTFTQISHSSTGEAYRLCHVMKSAHQAIEVMIRADNEIKYVPAGHQNSERSY